LFSCQNYFKVLERNSKYKIKPVDTKVESCDSDKLNMISQTNFNKEKFEKYLKHYKITSFGDKIVSWVLYQSLLRPDINLNNARFSFIIGNHKNYQFLDYKNISEMPKKTNFKAGLLYISKNYGKLPLNTLIKLTNKFFTNIKVSKEIEDFLTANKSEVSANEIWFKKFTKGKITLKKGESYTPFKNTKVNFNQAHTPTTPLFSYLSTSKENEIKCNQDLNLFKKQIYLTNYIPSLRNTSFAITENKRIFIASLTSAFQSLNKSETPAITSSICIIKKPKNKRVILYSLPGIDPAQHIYNLLNYEIDKAEQLKELEEYILFPRHQFVTNPSKLLYESNRGTKGQLQQFLNLNYPLYHAERLGNIWSFISLNHSSLTTVLDPRWDTVQSCKR
tara:strand:+ start:27811 stop:28983 length:1173 start_codon:yes stop_codon:yes gene_type:complete